MRVSSIQSTIENVNGQKYANFLLSLPPLEEQAAAVRFLDFADQQISRLIRNKRRLIVLLNEEKQAIIQQAVTRGLDPDVPIKPSGVEWLGKIPAHWEIGRIKDLFWNLDSRRIPLSSTERGGMTKQLYDYYGASGVIDKVDDYLFDDELILLAEDGANLVLRNLPLVVTARGKFWVNNHAHVLKPKRGSLEFFAHMLERIDFRPWITGAAQPKLTGERLMAVPLPVPPVEEQRAIVVQIDEKTATLKRTIETSTREIDLIREYRTRLIADVVTGQLDVREAAASLPNIEVSSVDAPDMETGSFHDDNDFADGFEALNVEDDLSVGALN